MSESVRETIDRVMQQAGYYDHPYRVGERTFFVNGDSPFAQNKTGNNANLNNMQKYNQETLNNTASMNGQQALEQANNMKQSISQNLENDLVIANTNLSPWQKIGQMTWNNLSNFNPLSRFGETLGTLQAAKQEMEQVKQPGYDNYAHRYGMYTNAQSGLDKAAYTLGLGVAKEAYDIGKKVIFNNNFWSEPNKIEKLHNVLQDSWKDMQNNYEAVKAGLQNPNLDGRLWLNDFDYERNEWRK